ncbi:retrovirus-related pol polyprotein from transposon TNT 1-94 [Tanacetum coccineum]|uniref:Retrovirus-related pol polyprotein from transposon TNT 1-94 n=1 Tax=Tanacetum coccineum TaxID=301880 RepID=A0ABQ5CN87_9ASTR
MRTNTLYTLGEGYLYQDSLSWTPSFSNTGRAWGLVGLKPDTRDQLDYINDPDTQSKDTNLKKRVLLNTKSKSTSKDVKKSQCSVSLVSNKRVTMNSNVSESNANVLKAKNVNVVNDGSNLGLRHNLFSVRQLCDGDLEVTFRCNTCCVWNLEGDDLLTGSRDSNLYTISISKMEASSPFCLMSKATSTKSWLWNSQLSHLNFGTINHLTKQDLVNGLPRFKYDKDHLCSACEQGKSKKATFLPKLIPNSSEESNEIPSKEDFDNLFGHMYEEYCATRTPKVSDNSAANTLDNEYNPSSSSIIVEDHDAPQLVTSSEEPIANEITTPVLKNHSDE